jgi:Mg2+/citrate symporter
MPSKKVSPFLITGIVEEAGIVRRIPWSEERLRVLEALDEDPALVVGGWVEGAGD